MMHRVNRDPFDAWSLAHFVAGMGMAWVGIRKEDDAVALAVAFELVEPPLEAWIRRTLGYPTSEETAGNSLIDAAITFLGWYVVARPDQRR